MTATLPAFPRRACALVPLCSSLACAGLAACGPPPPPPVPVVVVVPVAAGTSSAAVEVEESPPLLCPPRTIFVAGGSGLVDDKQVTVRDFCMDVTEVTASAYATCVQRGLCNEEALECDDAWTYGRPGREDHPINCVSWKQADIYCRAVGERLPTFEEWEWAAQSGREQRRFAWGAEDPVEGTMCWSMGTAKDHTCPVGGFPAARTPSGIDDLFGNVWEYLSPSQRKGIINVARGGSWQNSGVDVLEGDNPGGFMAEFERNDVVGFRCLYDGDRAPRPARADPPSVDGALRDLDEP